MDPISTHDYLHVPRSPNLEKPKDQDRTRPLLNSYLKKKKIKDQFCGNTPIIHKTDYLVWCLEFNTWSWWWCTCLSVSTHLCARVCNIKRGEGIWLMKAICSLPSRTSGDMRGTGILDETLSVCNNAACEHFPKTQIVIYFIILNRKWSTDGFDILSMSIQILHQS